MIDRVLSRKETRKVKAVEFCAYVRKVLAEAHEAAAAAAKKSLDAPDRIPEGHDHCGSATVVVFKPSYRLREALKALGEVQRDYNGAWYISNFRKHVNSQSITVHEKACAAACAVLKRAFPGEGEFSAPSRID